MNNQMMIKQLYISLMVLTVGYGQSFFPLFPSEFGLMDAQKISSGAVGIIANSSYSSIWENPAMLDFGNDGLKASMSFGLQRREEFRSVQMIDMFDDVVTNNAYAGNRNFYKTYHGGLTGSLPMLSDKIKFGLGVTPFWDFNYNYNEEVRGNLPSGEYNRDPVVGYHVLDRTGVIHSVGGGFSVKILSTLNIGLSISSLVGTNLNGRTEVVVLDSFDVDAALAGFPYSLGGDITLNESSMLINTGFIWDFGKGNRLGFSYRSGVSLTTDDNAWYPGINERTQLPGLMLVSDTTLSQTTELPAQFGLGYQRRMDHTMYPVVVNLEVRYVDWTQYT
ncbi:MAG: hypothetical protein HQ510_03355, partial [Candidatus Marinimicrobia bacterium]|nr:hypothetical protein [Candidatus Neomarinimicrobiota bacterium]